MPDTWLHLLHPKTGERYAVQPKDYQEKHEAGFRLDPEVGGQEAPKINKASNDAHNAATATKSAE